MSTLAILPIAKEVRVEYDTLLKIEENDNRCQLILAPRAPLNTTSWTIRKVLGVCSSIYDSLHKSNRIEIKFIPPAYVRDYI